MAITVKDKNIKENLVDENGNILGSISYNPEDIKAFRKLSDILNFINEMSKNTKYLNQLGVLPKENISLDDFYKYEELFSGVRNELHTIGDLIEETKTSIDEIFGEGTSYILMGNGEDLELLMPLLDEVMPKFKSKREEKVNQYLDNDESVL